VRIKSKALKLTTLSDRVEIKNISKRTVYIGTETVTKENGYPLMVGKTLSILKVDGKEFPPTVYVVG